MELLALLKLGTPALVIGMIVVLERIRGAVGSIREDLQEIKDGMIWHDTCTARHDEIDRRLGNVERATGLNGRKVG